jgi:hypothetical protein
MTDEHHADRRSFLRTGAIAGTALVAGASGAIAQQVVNTATSNAPLTNGDIDILTFLAASAGLDLDRQCAASGDRRLRGLDAGRLKQGPAKPEPPSSADPTVLIPF